MSADIEAVLDLGEASQESEIGARAPAFTDGMLRDYREAADIADEDDLDLALLILQRRRGHARSRARSDGEARPGRGEELRRTLEAGQRESVDAIVSGALGHSWDSFFEITGTATVPAGVGTGIDIGFEGGSRRWGGNTDTTVGDGAGAAEYRQRRRALARRRVTVIHAREIS
jgi:hypothetical protein